MEDKMLNTPQGLLETIVNKDNVASAVMLEFFSEGAGTLVITVSLKFLPTLRGVLFPYYKSHLQLKFELEAKKYLPKEVEVSIIFSI